MGDQAPGIPSPSELGALNPVVASILLVVVGIATVLVYFGPVIRDRLSRKPPPDPPPADPKGRHEQATVQVPVPAVATAAVDRSAEITDRYIASLEKRIEQLEREVKQLRADNEDMARQLNMRRRGSSYY